MPDSAEAVRAGSVPLHRKERPLHDLSLTELAGLIRRRDVSPVEVTAAVLHRIGALDGALHSFARTTPESALAEARRAESEIAAGEYRGPLHGVPIGVKDLFWTKDVPTAAGMSIHRNFRPPEDATVVARLRRAGAVLLGKLEMTEGAYSDHHPTILAPKNPWDAKLWPGISSSGSGVAVAAGLCFGATASDTGGSIRWPAAANGVTGLKPTWGRVSRHGTFALAPSLDHVGVLARTALDAGAMLNAMAGPDPEDPTASQIAMRPCPANAPNGLAGVSIGVDRRWNETDVDAIVRRTLEEATETFRALGADIVEVSAPDVANAVADWPLNCAIEAAVEHRATYPARKADYGDVLASVIDAGLAASAVDHQHILLRRMKLRGAFDALFGRIDALLVPAHPFAPLTLEDVRALGAQPALVAKLQRFTCPFNMTGHPTITLPAGRDADGAPVAIQIVGGGFSESALVSVGAAFQRETGWHKRRPPL